MFSSSRSSSPILSQKPVKKRKPGKEKHPKSKPAVEHTADGKNEGNSAHAHWEYKPPDGFVLLDHANADSDDFDWDALKEDEDLELWILRVPEGVSSVFNAMSKLLKPPPRSNQNT